MYETNKNFQKGMREYFFVLVQPSAARTAGETPLKTALLYHKTKYGRTQKKGKKKL